MSGLYLGILILLSNLASEYLYMLIFPAVYWFFDRRYGRDLLFVFLLSAYLAVVLKFVFRLPRPPGSRWQVREEGYAMPSGHSTIASGFWTMVLLKSKNIKKVEVKYSIAALCLAVPLLVAFSRVALGVHHVQDVIAGLLLGLILALAVHGISPLTEGFKTYLGPVQRFTYPIIVPFFMFSLGSLIAEGDYVDVYFLAKISGVLTGFSLGESHSRVDYNRPRSGLQMLFAYLGGIGLCAFLFLVPAGIEAVFNDPNVNVVVLYLRSALYGLGVSYIVPKIYNGFLSKEQSEQDS